MHQRLNQERRATVRISGGSDLALARARCRKKSWLPPTISLQSRKQGQPSARDRTRPSTRGICVPWCGVPGREQPRLGWHTVSVGSIGSDRTDQSRVDRQLGTVEERQTVCNHFEATVIQLASWQEVEVLDPDVGGHPRSSLSADARGTTLQGKPPTSEHP